MKAFRVWIVLLLAVLLPLRGALAAAMPCAGPGMASQGAQHTGHGGEHHAAGSEHHAASHDHGGHAHDHHEAGAGDIGDKCNLCSASCSMTALAGTASSVAHLPLGAASFPRLSAPPPDFHSGGQERPPRSI